MYTKYNNVNNDQVSDHLKVFRPKLFERFSNVFPRKLFYFFILHAISKWFFLYLNVLFIINKFQDHIFGGFPT